MAVTTTPRQLIVAAYGTSAKNRPDLIATIATELLNVTNRAMRGVYAVAARVNPLHFGETAAVAFSGTGWARPPQAETIFRIDGASGEVVVVAFDQRQAEPGKPAVFEFGQVFQPASAAAVNPQSGSLTFSYSKRPVDAAGLDSTLDPLWNEDFNELVVQQIALYLAIKDGRAEEVPGIAAERDRWLALFVAFLEHSTVNVRRMYGSVRKFNAPSIVSLTDLLVGGKAA